MIMQYAQKISVSEKMLMKMPQNMEFEFAAGIPEVPLSTYSYSKY